MASLAEMKLPMTQLRGFVSFYQRVDQGDVEERWPKNENSLIVGWKGHGPVKLWYLRPYLGPAWRIVGRGVPTAQTLLTFDKSDLAALKRIMQSLYLSYIHIHIHTYVYIYIYIHLNIYIYICFYMYIYFHIYIYTYVFIYIYIFSQTYFYIYIHKWFSSLYIYIII